MPPAVYSAPDPKRLCKERRSREAGDTFYLCFYYVIFWRPFEITVRPCTFWAYRSVLHKSSSSKKLCLSQVPLVFVIMAGKKRRDYKAVLDAVISIFPPPPRVTKVMLDFEKAVWSALRQTLPGVQLKGCSFHWTQALWRKVQSQTVKSLIGQTNRL